MKMGEMADMAEEMGSKQKSDQGEGGLDLDKETASKVKQLVGQLESICSENGCELEELVEFGKGGAQDDESAEGEDPMVSKYASQLKAKRNAQMSEGDMG